MSDVTAKATIAAYFKAFNAGDTDAMLACLADDIAHHVNEGRIRTGKAAFAEFCAHMARCYREELTDMVIFAAADGTRGAAEYTVNGTYLATDAGLPEANGQTYRLPAGSFFSLQDGKITRVTTYYNLADWVAQVSA
ncbi:ketosteroid isomerase-related protein [Rhodalgimonas zhirmunskyi]|uniref:Nuclear transport factor 2 family protein n=1 Tax=Rhodalgimonas zhirmunskyi TaxID=2964767 RepID=A0AAJ1U969_9RHOB|nr:ketosteroid isomerase-related protein [Rhodoalgimonas zhirmunskyi]MDQ2095090.1 nuclear transport factor 2 family protein [Rhodoalgimonas zhirmunskyi]